LIGLDVVSAKYCKALYVVVLKNPVAANTTQALRAKGQSCLRRCQTKGNNTKTATTHRKKFKVMGGIAPAAIRPTIALLAHIKGGTTKNNRVKGRIETDHFQGLSRPTARDAKNKAIKSIAGFNLP
jgi:hypothetical protein